MQPRTHPTEQIYLHPEDAKSSRPRKSSPLRRTSIPPSTQKKSKNHRRHRPNLPQWKKLLWVKQNFPDNFTDEDTFLDHLQRNPSLRPYEFWELVADSTVIVQHICSVVIFVCCFTAIFQERVSPQTVVWWATFGTVLAWGGRDLWVGDEGPEGREGHGEHGEQGQGGMKFTTDTPSTTENASTMGSNGTPPSLVPSRMQYRLSTAKSAVLIYCFLLGLSPILKSLTKSTSSDSIWALSSILMFTNVFTFDYGAGPEAKFPASLSTNAALMASTVLASRLPSTTHVFSLTLFSIEVFGLFPVFRRYLLHCSWRGHVLLTAGLVVGASGGLSMTISGRGIGVGIVGVVLGGLVTCLSMGMTSWWLIGLQRYKNEIHGPWDPARPVIGRHWD
ncbi:phosphatidylinositol N-acetylglucosaminyltransferase [Piedraia hortae CBS 480.64]|uniref:Phosphatidylinositol N-acetylglucosaminyltransferase n=1 Tax=Piedraia hortae CBS 480.64 TaxID=1314780 RepID=A0A6A7C1U6_9PEZI|nr:phosphatidylinositol N-acetylglucosaminyltransferase [Piedraia hortae CBS 480.64]